MVIYNLQNAFIRCKQLEHFYQRFDQREKRFLGIVKENICLLFNPVALSSALFATLPLCEENQNKKRKNKVLKELFQQVN